jgi:hypothetical protein
VPCEDPADLTCPQNLGAEGVTEPAPVEDSILPSGDPADLACADPNAATEEVADPGVAEEGVTEPEVATEAIPEPPPE